MTEESEKPALSKDDAVKNKDAPPPSATFDSILEAIGTFGPRQRLIFFFISMAEFFGAFHMLLPVFVGAEPNWYCVPPGGAMNVTEDRNDTFKECEVLEGTCDEIVFRDDFTSIVSEWQLVCRYSYVSDLMTSIQMVGLMLGAASIGQLSDLIGRKKSFFLAFFVMTAGGLGSAFCQSWQAYAVCRVFVGFGFGGNQVVQVVFPMEFLGKKWRVFCGTMGFWAMGIMALTGIAYFLSDWRTLTIVSSCIPICYFGAWWFIPESPRWLIQHGKMDEAEKIMADIALKNDKPKPNMELLKRIVEEESRVTRKYTYLDLCRTWRYAKMTGVKFLAWFTVFVLYYAGSYNVKNFSGNRHFNMMLSSIIDWVAMVSVIPVLTLMGRRHGCWLYLGLGLAMVLSIWFIILAGKESALAGLFLAFALIAKSSGLAGTYSVQIFSAELFPTAIRNIGVGCGSIAARIGGILAPQLVYLGTINQSAPYIITSALCSFTIPMLLLVPETRGRNLQDTYGDEEKAKDSSSEEELKPLPQV